MRAHLNKLHHGKLVECRAENTGYEMHTLRPAQTKIEVHCKFRGFNRQISCIIYITNYISYFLLDNSLVINLDILVTTQKVRYITYAI